MRYQGAGRYGLLDLPGAGDRRRHGLQSRRLASSEFRQAAAQRFVALDLDHHGQLGACRSSKRSGPRRRPPQPQQSDEDRQPFRRHPLRRNSQSGLTGEPCLAMISAGAWSSLAALILAVARAAAHQSRGRSTSSAMPGRPSSARWASRSARTRRRMTRSPAGFGKADRNHDGLLTPDEMGRTPTASSRRSTPTATA